MKLSFVVTVAEKLSACFSQCLAKAVKVTANIGTKNRISTIYDKELCI
jgi:hypothetical protein